MLQQVLDGAELLDELLGRLGPHARAAGDIVSGISHQSQDVDELLGRQDAILVVDFFHAQDFLLERVIDLDVGRYQLPEVLVTSDHIGEETLLLGLVGEGTDDIVGLKAFYLKDGDAVGLEDAFDVGHGNEDALGRLVAVGLVGRVVLMPERLAPWWVKAHGDVAGLFTLEQVLQGVDKAEHGRRVDAGRGDARATYHGIKCPENQCVGIEKQQFLGGFHNRYSFVGHKGSEKFSVLKFSVSSFYHWKRGRP